MTFKSMMIICKLLNTTVHLKVCMYMWSTKQNKFEYVSRTYTYSNLGPTGFVDPVHVFAELRSVAISVPVILCHKQERVNHFMEKGLWQPVKIN